MATSLCGNGDMLKKDGLMTKLVLHNVPTSLTKTELVELLTDIAGTPMTLYLNDVLKKKPMAKVTWALLVVKNVSATGRIFKKLHNIPPYNIEVQAMTEWYSERWSRICLDDMYGSDRVHEASNAVQGMFKDLDHKLEIAKDIMVVTGADDRPDKSRMLTRNAKQCVACDGSANFECQCKAMFCSEECFNENWSWHYKFCCPSPKSSHQENAGQNLKPSAASHTLNTCVKIPLLKTPLQPSVINRKEFAKVWQGNKDPLVTDIKEERVVQQRQQTRENYLPGEKEGQIVRSPEAKWNGNSQQSNPAQERQTHENYQSNVGGYDPRRNQGQQNNNRGGGGRGDQSGRNYSEQSRVSRGDSQGGWTSDYARDDYQSKEKGHYPQQGGWKDKRQEQSNSGYARDGDQSYSNQQRGKPEQGSYNNQSKERGQYPQQEGWKGNRQEQNSGYARDSEQSKDRAYANQQRGWNGNRAEQDNSRDRQHGDGQSKERAYYPQQQGGWKGSRPEQGNPDRSRDGDQSKENPRYFQQYEPQTTRQMSWKGGPGREETKTDGRNKIKTPPANFVQPFNVSSVALKNLLSEKEKLGQSSEEKTTPSLETTEQIVATTIASVTGDSNVPKQESNEAIQDGQVAKQEQGTELTKPVSDSAYSVAKFMLDDVAWELLGDPGCELNVTITWVLTADTLVVSKCDNNFAKLFEQLPVNIADFIANHKQPLEYTPEINELVLAPFDGAYYRGIVASITEGQANVSFMEYGNIESIPVKDLFPVNQIIACVPSVSHNVFVDLLIPSKLSELSLEQTKLLRNMLKVDTTHKAIILAIKEDKYTLHFPDVTEAVQKLAEIK